LRALSIVSVFPKILIEMLWDIQRREMSFQIIDFGIPLCITALWRLEVLATAVKPINQAPGI
jgi:hypothetical protein